MDDQLFAAREIRKKLWWMIPFFSGFALFSFWVAQKFFIADFIDVLNSAPVVRIAPLGLLAPLMVLLSLVVVVLAVVRSISCRGIWPKRLEHLMNGIVFASAGLVVLIVLGSSSVQNHFMPQSGYVRCDSLQGSPSLWFTDWV